MTMQKVPESQVEESVLNGSFSFPKGSTINVINPQGETVSIPSEEAKDAFEQGYKYETSFQGAVRNAADKYTPMQKAFSAFAGQAADEALMGVPELGYDKLADPFKVAVKDRIKKDAQLANDIGGIAGFGASMLYGGPIAKILGVGAKTGRVAEEIVASQLAKRGVTRGSESLAKDILARSASTAAKLGTEGVIATAPIAGGDAVFETIDAINEDRLPNYKASAEALAIGGGVGFGLGVLSGPLSATVSRIGNKIKKSASKIAGTADEVAGTTAPNADNPGDGTLLGVAQANGVDESVLGKLKEEMGKLKPNHKEILDAKDRLMIDDILEEQLSASDAVKRLSSSLRQNPTVAGITRQNRLGKIYGQVEDRLKSIIGVEGFDKSVYQAGTEVKQKLISRAQSAIDKEAEMFQALKMDYGQINVNPKVLKNAIKSLSNISETALDEETIALSRRLSGRLSEGRVASLDDLKQVRTALYDLYGPNKAKNKAVSAIVDELNAIEDKTVNRAIQDRIKKASVPGLQTLEDASHLEGMFQEMKKAKANWASLAQDLGETAEEMNLGRIRSPRDFVDKLKNTDAEQVVKKFIPNSDIKSAARLAEKYPEEFKVISDLRKARLIDSAISERNGQFNVHSFMRKWSDLEPEMKELLVGKERLGMMRDVDVFTKSLPENMNPSGTASGIQWGNFLNPIQIMQEGSDLVKQEFLRKTVQVDGLIAAENQTSFISKQLDRIYDTLRGLEKARPKSDSVGKSISAIGDIFNNNRDDRDAQFQSLQAKLSEAAANPVYVANALSEKLSPLSETGAPQTSYALGEHIANAVAYLYKEMPKAPVTGNGFYNPKWKPSGADLAKFERKVSVVNNPLVVIDALADGTLTSDHIHALSSNYPFVYNALRKRIIDHLAENPMEFSYQNRLKLSLLMGVDADPSVSGPMIKGFQDGFAGTEHLDNNKNELARVSGLEKIRLDTDYETESQRLIRKRRG